MASQMLLRLARAGAKTPLLRMATKATNRTTATWRMTTTTMTRSSQRCFSSALSQEELLHESESFLTGTSSLYAEQMYEQYREDPNSIHPSWKKYFDNVEEGLPYDESAFNKPTAAASSVKRAISGVRSFGHILDCFFICFFAQIYIYIYILSILPPHIPLFLFHLFIIEFIFAL